MYNYNSNIVFIFTNGYPPILNFTMTAIEYWKHEWIKENLRCSFKAYFVFPIILLGFIFIPLEIVFQLYTFDQIYQFQTVN